MLTRDFQPSITLQNGHLVFLGPYLQYFSNCQSLTIKWILENRSKNPGIEPGDMFLSNDPYVGSPHQPDAVVAAPVFVGDELFCWVADVLNHDVWRHRRGQLLHACGRHVRRPAGAARGSGAHPQR